MAFAAAHAKEVNVLAQKHSLTINHVNTLIGGAHLIKPKCQPNLTNTVAHWKANEMNMGMFFFPFSISI